MSDRILQDLSDKYRGNDKYIPEWVKDIDWPLGSVRVNLYDSGLNLQSTWERDAVDGSIAKELDWVEPYNGSLYSTELCGADVDKREFSTGAVRDKTEGKGRYDLIPTRAMRLLAVHFQNGGKHYGDRNWEAGIPLSVYVDSAKRHLDKFIEGHVDERHDVACLWNIACLIETLEKVKEDKLPETLIDLPEVSIIGD